MSVITTSGAKPAPASAPSSPVRPNRPLGIRARLLGRKVGLWIGLLIGAGFAGLPVLWMLSSSFKRNTEIFALPPVLVTENFSFEAYVSILQDPEKIRFFINSYVVAGSVTVLTVFVGILAAYAFSRFEFRGKHLINMVIVSVQAVPPITLLIPYFGLVVLLGLYDTYPGLIFTYMVFTLPYSIIMMTAYINTLPKELDEAVRVDGAGSWTALWKVLVPIATPGIISVSVYTFMIAWNEYLFALTLTRTVEMRTVPIGIQLLMGQHSYEWNEMMAMSLMGSVPVLILFVIFQRYFLNGLASGAVKA